MHRTTDGGQTWQVISPDLTLNDRSRQQRSGGLTPDNVGVEYAGVVFAIAESPREKGVIWAGTNDGQLQVTRDAGGALDQRHREHSRPAAVGHGQQHRAVAIRQRRPPTSPSTCTRSNNRDPFVFKTTRLRADVAARSPATFRRACYSYAHCVREDPVKRGLLYLGTENALYFSPDDGQHWLPLQSGLPHAPVHWLTIQEHFNDLVVATYGRGFYILDDITPLRTLTPEALNETAHLFAPRPTYRFRTITDPMMMPDDATEGRNAPYGAAITFSLKAAPPDDARAETKIVISDAAGKVVRTLEVGKEATAGVNRVWWDLRMDPTDEIMLRTRPLLRAGVRARPRRHAQVPDRWRRCRCSCRPAPTR